MTVKSEGRSVVVSPGDLVKTNPKRKFMSKAEALEDDKRMKARKVVVTKAGRDFDEDVDEGQEIPDVQVDVAEVQEEVAEKPVKNKRVKKSKKVNE